VVVIPPTPPGGCTKDLVREMCPPETFDVGLTLVLELRGSGMYDNSWENVAKEFAHWAESLGYATPGGSALMIGSTRLEIVGADVGQILAEWRWKGLNALVEITAQVLFERVTLACRRTWPCIDGKYAAPVTTTTRTRHQRYSAAPQTIGNIKRHVTVDANSLVRFLRAVWGPYAAGQRASEAFAERCH
jgi:hypothetical protein